MKKTGCKYTGITLSIEQLKYAEEKVKEAGLQVCVEQSIDWFFYLWSHQKAITKDDITYESPGSDYIWALRLSSTIWC